MATETVDNDTQMETQTEGQGGGPSFGEIIQQRLDKKTETARETTKPTETEKAVTKPTEAVTKEEKAVTKPAETSVGDVLDAALAGGGEKKEEKPVLSPEEEYKDATEGITSAKVKERIVGMRGKITELWKENQKLRERPEAPAKVNALEDPEVVALIKAKDEELQKASDALLAFNLEAHPEFQREYVIPREKHARNAAQKLQSYGGNGQALLDALYMPEGIRRDEAVATLLENVPDYAKNKITSIIAQIETLDEGAAEKRANAPKTWEEFSAKDIEARQKKAAEYQGKIKGIFEEVKAELSETAFFRQLGEDVKGSSEWNADRDGAFERGLNHIIGSNNNAKSSLITAIKGERYDAVAKMLQEERGLRRAAEKRISELEGASPTFRGTRAPVTSEVEEEKEKPFGQIVADRAARRAAGDD